MTGFTSHNIRLPDGTETLPGVQVLADTGIARTALEDLGLVFPDPVGVRVADLGCLEGGYTVELARAGYDVVGIEARAANYAKCVRVAGAVGLPNLSFVNDDVRNIASLGMFDAVFCCGLLYHLDFPADFLRVLGECTRRMLIVNTHYSTHPNANHEGYQGHWYREGGADDLWSSHENTQSFWPVKEGLMAAMSAAGFGRVFQQFDQDTTPGTYVDHHGRPVEARGMFVGIKEAA